MFKIKSIIVCMLFLMTFSTSLQAGIAEQVGNQFIVENPELYNRMLKAEKVCTSPDRFQRNMTFFKTDEPLGKFLRFQGNSIFSRMTRLPLNLVRGSVSGIHYLAKKGYSWYYGKTNEVDAGKIARAVLTHMMLSTHEDLNLTTPQTACMAACVTRVMVKYLPCWKLRSFKSVFAPPEQVLCQQNGQCVDFAHVFESFATDLGIPTYSFMSTAGTRKSAIWLGTTVGAGIDYCIDGTCSFNPITQSNAINILSQVVIGHYITQVNLDGEDFIFDPMGDYSSYDYTCTFHKR